MTTLGSYVRKHWATYTMAILFMIIAIALDMMFPKVTERIVNEVIIGQNFTYFPFLLLAIILIGVGRSVFGYFKEFTFDKNCITIGTEMRKDLFDHIQSLSLDYFDDSSTGELMARVKDDIDKIFQLVGMVAMRGMEVTLNSVLILYFMFSINVPLTFLPLTFMVICGTTAIVMEKKLDKVYDAISEENAEMTPTPEWYASDAAQMLTIPTMVKGETAFLVTGDASRNKIQTMPGGAMSTAVVELPAAWNELMEEKGYEPLRSFYLEPIDDSDYNPVTDIEEVDAQPAPAAEQAGNGKVRYYNLNGYESGSPFDGVNIEVTTGNGNARSARKVLRTN